MPPDVAVQQAVIAAAKAAQAAAIQMAKVRARVGASWIHDGRTWVCDCNRFSWICRTKLLLWLKRRLRQPEVVVQG